jgi:hypothetical protein
MQPFKRRRRTRRDMIVLGGWLFADLLLGLAMLFLVANTVGSEPATPTPTAEPDYLATATVEFAEQQASNEETIEALENDIAQANLSAEQTADASSNQQEQIAAQATEEAVAAQTEAAMTDSEQATFAADSTAAAASAQETIAAISTEQASNESESDQAALDLATAAAEATEIASSVNAQSTEQAELAAIATENAASGANSQGTVIALETAQAESQSAQATSDANASNAQSTADALTSQQANIDATIATLEQEARANTLNPQSISETISVDMNGILAGDQGAIDDAVDELHGVLDKYVNGDNCKIGFTNIATNSPDVAIGSQTSRALGELIQQEFPSLLLEIEGQEPTLAFEAIGNVGRQPEGEVELQLFVNFGCAPSG